MKRSPSAPDESDSESCPGTVTRRWLGAGNAAGPTRDRLIIMMIQVGSELPLSGSRPGTATGRSGICTCIDTTGASLLP